MTESSLEQLVDAQIDFRLATVYTCLVCSISNVREINSQILVDVQPIVNRVYKDGEIQAYPQILAVPVVFPRSSVGGVTFPLRKGDTVVVVFSKNGLDVFKQGATEEHDPVDTRQFSLRDALAFPCVFPFTKNPDSGRSLTYSSTDTILATNLGEGSECEVRLRPDGSIGITGTSVSVKAASTTIESPNIILSGQITLNGDVAVTGGLGVGGASVFTGTTLMQGTNTFAGDTIFTGDIDIAGALSTTGSANFAGANTFVGISTFNGSLISTTSTSLFGVATYNLQTIATV